MKRFSRENPEKFREMTSSDICFWENSRTGKDGTPWASFGVRGDLEFELTCEPIPLTSTHETESSIKTPPGG